VLLPVCFRGWHGHNFLITKIIKVITITKLITATTQVTLVLRVSLSFPLNVLGCYYIHIQSF